MFMCDRTSVLKLDLDSIVDAFMAAAMVCKAHEFYHECFNQTQRDLGILVFEKAGDRRPTPAIQVLDVGGLPIISLDQVNFN